MANVKLILRDDVPKLGDAGDVVEVKPGYARNYLIPQGLAIHASRGKLAELEHHRRQIEAQVAAQKSEREALRDRIQAVALEVTAQVGEEGRLFGSVTSTNIADLLEEQGIEVDRRRILLDQPIKEAGEHVVPIRLHREVTAEVRVRVVAANPPPGAEAAAALEAEAEAAEAAREADRDEDEERPSPGGDEEA